MRRRMDSMPDFYIPSPDDRQLSEVLQHPVRITLHKGSGEVLEIEGVPGVVNVTEEHPEVDRMGGDWGAICEVFRKSNYYYVNIQGVSLAPGDQILVYGQSGAMAELKVADIENGRARIDTPIVRVKE